jgi:hypothetical protein
LSITDILFGLLMAGNLSGKMETAGLAKADPDLRGNPEEDCSDRQVI